MPVTWNLKKWLALKHDIYRPSELQTLLSERVGITLSLQAISSLIKGQPQAIRIQTIQALCNALNCKLSDFCEVSPDPEADQQKQRKVVGEKPVPLYGKSKKIKDDNPFPSALDYMPPKKDA